MSWANWNKTRDFDGSFLTEEFERADGKFRVGSNQSTRELSKPYYVQRNYNGRWSGSADFRKRFGSAEAAMHAVNKRCPVDGSDNCKVA